MTSHLKIACVLLALVAAPATLSAEDAPKRAPGSDPYTLPTCPVSGEKLGGAESPVVKVYDGREVRLCCGECVTDFEADKTKFFKQIDAAMIADQKPHYSLKTCAVSGTSLEQDGKALGTDLVLGNQLVRVCGKECEQKAQAAVKETVAKVKAALAKAQLEAYPLKTCVISGGELGAMGKPIDLVIASRLVRLCCKGCLPKIDANPLAALAKLRPAKGKGEDEDEGEGEKSEGEDENEDEPGDGDEGM